MNMYQMIKRKKDTPIQPFQGLERIPSEREAIFGREQQSQQLSKSMKEVVDNPLLAEIVENGGESNPVKQKRKSKSTREIPFNPSSSLFQNSSPEDRSPQRSPKESPQKANQKSPKRLTENVPTKDFLSSLVEEVDSSAPTHASVGELVFEPDDNGGNNIPRNATPPASKRRPEEYQTPEQEQQQEIKFSPRQVKAVAVFEAGAESDDETYIRDEHYDQQHDQQPGQKPDQQPDRNSEEKDIRRNDENDGEKTNEFAAEYFKRHLAKSINQSHEQIHDKKPELNPAHFVKQGPVQYSTPNLEQHSPKKSQPVRFREEIDVSYAPSYGGAINRFSATNKRMDSTVSRYQNVVNDNTSVYDDGLSVCDTVFTHDYASGVPTNLDLMDPTSFDVMTIASMDDGTVMEDATVVEDEAFQGELWTRLQKKRSVMKPTIDSGDDRVQTKYNKYRNLASYGNRPTATNIRQSATLRQSASILQSSSTRQSAATNQSSSRRRQPRRESTGDSSMQLALGTRHTLSIGTLNVEQSDRIMEQRQSGIQDMHQNVDKRVSTMNNSNEKDLNFLREQLHHVRSSETPRKNDGEHESVLHAFTLAAPVRDNNSHRGPQTMQDVQRSEKKYQQKNNVGIKDLHQQHNN
mmetsp:Transcript_23956/g.26470  ORF Transcript_23956/g.26470 Transcript_23956/m.26470 type:complete len:634 (+) Transcript_23956:67-1968(+)